jgi:membrane associated rhomboid family serine protease
VAATSGSLTFAFDYSLYHCLSEMSSRVTELFSKIPLVTTVLLALNCCTHAIIFLFSLNPGEFAISADLVLDGDYYRVMSAAFVHGGIMHIFMNMTSLLQLGSSLEAQFGSTQFAFLTLWSTLLIGAVYVLLSW